MVSYVGYMGSTDKDPLQVLRPFTKKNGKIRIPHVLQAHNSPRHQAEVPSTLSPIPVSETCEIACATTVGPFERDDARERVEFRVSRV